MGKACSIPFITNNVSESSLRSVSIVDVKRCMLRMYLFMQLSSRSRPILGRTDAQFDEIHQTHPMGPTLASG